MSQGRLWSRTLDQAKATELAGTDGAFAPFFSPDGRWVAFFANGKLKKISVEGGTEVDLCSIDPGYDVDLYVSCDLLTMTAIWMGLNTVRKALSEGRIELVGDQLLAKSMQTWLGLSPFAKERKMVA